MSLNKITLKKEIYNNIKQASATKNNDYYIIAAQLYGVYRAVGGSKTIVLPPFCDEAVKFTYSLSRVKIKFDKLMKHKNIKDTDIIDILSSIDSINNIRCNIGTCTLVFMANVYNKESVIVIDKNRIYTIFYELLQTTISMLYPKAIFIDNNIKNIFTSNWEGGTYG